MASVFARRRISLESLDHVARIPAVSLEMGVQFRHPHFRSASKGHLSETILILPYDPTCRFCLSAYVFAFQLCSACNS